MDPITKTTIKKQNKVFQMVHSGHIFKFSKNQTMLQTYSGKRQADIFVFMSLVFKKNTFLNSV